MNSWLQSPIIHWAGLAMRVLHVYLRNLGIVAHHIQRAMSQQRLEGEYVSTRTQVRNREGVAKFMWMNMREICPFTQTPDQDAQAVAVKWAVTGADEERSHGVISIFPGGQVTPDSFAGNFTQLSDPAFSTLCTPANPVADIHLAGFQIHILDGQRAKLGGTQTSVQQGQDNGLVAVGTGPAHDKCLPVLRLSFPRVDAGLDQLFDILFGKSLDDMLRKLGWGDVDKGAGDFELFVQPGVERPQSNVDVAQRFGREGILVPVPTPGFVFGAHPGDVIGEIGRRDFGNILISDMFHPLV